MSSQMWEYTIRHYPVFKEDEIRQSQQELNTWGVYGWEVVSSAFASNTTQPWLTVIMKRPLDWKDPTKCKSDNLVEAGKEA